MSAAWHISRTALNTVLSTAYSSFRPLASSIFLGIGRPAYEEESIYYYLFDSCFSCTSAWILLQRESGRQDYPRDRIKDDPVYCSSSYMTDITKTRRPLFLYNHTYEKN